VRSVFNDEKKLSIAALSHTLPERRHRTNYAVIGHQPECCCGVVEPDVARLHAVTIKSCEGEDSSQIESDRHQVIGTSEALRWTKA
jgi:hypothetical protein